MSNERDGVISGIIERLQRDMALAQKHSLDHTVFVLRVAILDLKMALYEISDDELRQFIERIDDDADDNLVSGFPRNLA